MIPPKNFRKRPLRQLFSPCVFVVADRMVSPVVRDSPNVLALRASLGVEAEAAADRRFSEICRQIRNSAAG